MTEVTYHLDLFSGKVELTEYLEKIPKPKDELELTHLAEMQLGQRHLAAYNNLKDSNTLTAESVLALGGSSRYVHISVGVEPRVRESHQSA